MNYTKNLKLFKPSYDDDVDIQIINKNMDLLDNKVGDLPYLPLTGGAMSGDINLPIDIGLRHDVNTVIKFITQNGLKTVRFEGERLSFETNKGTTFKVDDVDIRFNNKVIPQIDDIGTSENGGYIKLSNGLTLQWGAVPMSKVSYEATEVTFLTPMPSANYSVIVNKTNLTSDRSDKKLGGEWICLTYNHKTTGFTVTNDNNNFGLFVNWIAVGGKI